MKKKIEYIKMLLERSNSNNVGIHTGKLTTKQIAELKKHFIVKKDLYGYTRFETFPKQ